MNSKEGNSTPPGEPSARASPSPFRKRAAPSSPQPSASSSDSEESPLHATERARSCRKRRRHDDTPRERSASRRGRTRSSSSSSQESALDRRFELLSQQLVSHLNNVLSANSNSPPCATADNLNFTGSLPAFQTLPAFNDIANLSVTVKEPSVASAKPERVTKINSLQRFDSSEWNAIRYIETQKKYLASPGFVEARVNEELRRCDDPIGSSSFTKNERSFAAISNAFMAQNEVVNQALQSFIDWSTTGGPLTANAIFDKLKDLFDNQSNYKIITNDIFQIICGKRAEALENRRRNLLKQIKDKFIREDVEKIPPSAEYMFNPQSLTTYIQKIGGVDKLVRQTAATRPRAVSPVPSTSFAPSTSFRNKPGDNRLPKRSSNYKKYTEQPRTNTSGNSKKKGGHQKDKGPKRPHKQK